MTHLTIEELTRDFPLFSAAVVVAEGLSIPAERSAELDGRDRRARGGLPGAVGRDGPVRHPGRRRLAHRLQGFGIKKTSYRCSVERLVKNVLAGARAAAINGFVDAYNAVSLAHVLCVGADDLDRIAPPLAFRFSRPGDTFIDMAAEAGEDPNDPPKTGEVVYADARHVLCRRWNWRQDARSIITPDTRRAVVTLQSNGEGEARAAADDLAAWLGRVCGATCQIVVADAATPTVEF